MMTRDPQQAFKNAIDRGALSDVSTWENFAGGWMYMHSDDQKDYFKNINRRHYMGVRYQGEPAEFLAGGC